MKDIEIHKVGSQSQDDEIDIVFVHGLMGDHEGTWTGSGSLLGSKPFWPKWLSALPGVGVWSVSYPTIVHKWQGRKLDVLSLANTIAHGLVINGLGARPMVLIGHSMGGLIIKEILASGRLPGGAGHRLQAACAGVIFYGTPHDGADLPEKLTEWVTIEGTHVEELRRGAPGLQGLNRKFGYWLNHIRPAREVTAYCETQPYAGTLVVDISSADPGLGKLVNVIELTYDHFDLCKPKLESDFRVGYVKDLVRRLRAESWTVGGVPDQHVLVSYAWGDTESADESSRLVSDLALAGIPVLSDWDYRDRDQEPPEQGWTAWRKQALERASMVLIIGGQRYRHINQNGQTSGSEFEGIILSNQDIDVFGLSRCMPLLTFGASPEHCLPEQLRLERYNGMRIPAGTPTIVARLCGRTPVLKGSE